jgi:AcrR family transcriptional regulator
MGIRERKKARTRQALVDAAARLFLERGVDATTMDDIARAAGMSRTSVFNYFGYKEMILCEIGARYVQEVAGPLLMDLDRPPQAIFQQVADGVAAVGSREPALIAAVAREMTHPDPERRLRAQVTMGYPAVVKEVLDRFADIGVLRHPERRDSYGNQIVDLLSGTLIREAGTLSPEQLRIEIQRAMDLFMTGAILQPAREPAEPDGGQTALSA